MGRGVVGKEVVFLHIFPVVALRVRQSEEPFLQNRVGFVPQGQGKTELLLIVANPQQAVFAPPVCVRTGLVMREEIPGCPAGRIILAHSPPLPFRSEEHTSELQSRENLVCRLLLEKKKKIEEEQYLRRKKEIKKGERK